MRFATIAHDSTINGEKMKTEVSFRRLGSRFTGSFFPGFNLLAISLIFIVLASLSRCYAASSPKPHPGTNSTPTINAYRAYPAQITSGTTSELIWVTTYATKIAITPGTFTSTDGRGTLVVSPATTTVYKLTATNASGSTSSAVMITVTAASKPVIKSFTANSSSITAGASDTLNWVTTGATKLAIHFDGSKRLDECEPWDHDDLRADGDEWGGGYDGDGRGDGYHGATGDFDDSVPVWKTRLRICGMQACGHRRYRAIQLLSEQQCRLPITAGGVEPGCGYGKHHECADWGTGDVYTGVGGDGCGQNAGDPADQLRH